MKINAKSNSKGNAMLLTMILILVMLTIIVGALNIAGLQSDIVHIDKSTSNTRTLAESGVEKTVDTVNKQIELSINDIMEEIRLKYLESEVRTNIPTSGGQFRYDDLGDVLEYGASTVGPNAPNGFELPTTNNKIKLNRAQQVNLRNTILDKIKAEILGTPAASKTITYEVKSDTIKQNHITTVSVELSEGASNEEYKIISTATTHKIGDMNDISNMQKVEAVVKVNLPDYIDTSIDENYRWLNNPAEILSGAIVSYGDITVKENGAKLHVVGDLKVKGFQADSNIDTLTGEVNAPHPDEKGGVIAIGKGTIDVDAPTSGFDLGNGITLNPLGSIYTTGNVMVTGGWGGYPYGGTSTSDYGATIDVDGNIVADTVGIVDDFYKGSSAQTPWTNKVRFTRIKAGKDIFVNNDVVIEKFVDNSNIIATNIFGIMDKDPSPKKHILSSGVEVELDDPNLSSGIFNRGDGCKILALGGMYVNGQPYINFNDGNGFHRLYESIGEPFEDVYSLDRYRTVKLGSDSSYITETDSPYLPLIKMNQVSFLGNAYAPANVSANGETKLIKDKLENESKAKKFFLGIGGSSENVTLSELSSNNSIFDVIKENAKAYYMADPSMLRVPESYAKYYDVDDTSDVPSYYYGLHAFMTATRSPFIGKDQSVFGSMSFSDAVRLDKIDSCAWTPANPVEAIVNGNNGADISSGIVDISKYYDKGNKPIPSIIIAKGGEITLKASEGAKNKFYGVIISEKRVTVNNNIEIHGSLVLGDSTKGSLSSTSGTSMLSIPAGVTLKVEYDPEALFKPKFANRDMFRCILDALRITNFRDSNGDLAKALNNLTTDKNVMYTNPRIKVEKEMALYVKTQSIVAKIDSIKKLN